MALLRNTSGYTLLELLVVVAIIGLVAAFAAPAASRVVAGATLNADARQAASELASLQRAAQERQETITVSTNDGAIAITPAGADSNLPNLSLSLEGSPISFFPDGTTSGGTLRLQEGTQEREIVITWLTGTVSTRAADATQ